MRVTYTGVIAASASDVWDRLIDIDVVLGLLPGANLTRDGDQVVGSLRVRPSTQVTYRITARASSSAEGENAATIALSGTEARGDGSLAATVSVSVRDEDGGSGLAATADIEATGRAADADEHGWTRVLSGFGNAMVASFERHPPGTPVPRPQRTEPAAARAAVNSEPQAASEPEPVPAAAKAPAKPPTPAPTATPTAVPSPSSGATVVTGERSKLPMVVGGLVLLLLIRWLLKRRG